MALMLKDDFELYGYESENTGCWHDIYYVDNSYWIGIEDVITVFDCTQNEFMLLLHNQSQDEKKNQSKEYDCLDKGDGKKGKKRLYNLMLVIKAATNLDLKEASRLNKWLEEQNSDVIKRKGSSAFIFAEAYHYLFRETITSDQHSTYTKAPVLALIAFNIELSLKSIIMLKTGSEKWMMNKKEGHCLDKLFYMLPDNIQRECFAKLKESSYDKSTVKKLLSTSSDAFVEYRYKYETDDTLIDKQTEQFLKILWSIVHEISFEAQKVYLENEV